jgi:hypothetical protein
LLHGTVAKALDAQNRLQIAATSIVMPNHNFVQFAARNKQVVTSATTTVTTSTGVAMALSDLPVGATVDIAGVDSGPGKSMTARIICVSM